jgi:putative acetyltransferase
MPSDARRILVRRMRPDEARTFLQIQRDSVRGLATHAYPQEVIDRWGVTVDEATLEQFLANPDGEIRLLADFDGQPAGLGALVLRNAELRACYVLPGAARRGVGTAIVAEIERLAREHGLARLDLEASLNAEPFYAALGYHVVERGETVLPNGCRMSSVRMRKVL